MCDLPHIILDHAQLSGGTRMRMGFMWTIAVSSICNTIQRMPMQAALAMQRARELEPAAHQAEALERLIRRIPEAHAGALQVNLLCWSLSH